MKEVKKFIPIKYTLSKDIWMCPAIKNVDCDLIQTFKRHFFLFLTLQIVIINYSSNINELLIC